MLFYSASTGGFYDASISPQIPSGAVEITREEHASLMDGQSQGKVITAGGDGRPFLADQPPPTAEQVAKQYEAATQAHLDAEAVAAGYDDIKNVVTYAEEPAVPKFQADGKAFRRWRSLVWAYAYEQLAAVQAGEREQPTIEEFLAELPVLELPA